MRVGGCCGRRRLGRRAPCHPHTLSKQTTNLPPSPHPPPPHHTHKQQSNNQKLHGLVTQMRSKRNFCIDIVLLCILLGIVAYLVTMFKKK